MLVKIKKLGQDVGWLISEKMTDENGQAIRDYRVGDVIDIPDASAQLKAGNAVRVEQVESKTGQLYYRELKEESPFIKPDGSETISARTFYLSHSKKFGERRKGVKRGDKAWDIDLGAFLADVIKDTKEKTAALAGIAIIKVAIALDGRRDLQQEFLDKRAEILRTRVAETTRQDLAALIEEEVGYCRGELLKGLRKSAGAMPPLE